MEGNLVEACVFLKQVDGFYSVFQTEVCPMCLVLEFCLQLLEMLF